MGDGDQPSTWGQTLNNNVFSLIDTAIAGITSVLLSSTDVTLTALDGAADTSRSAILVLHGTLTSNVEVVIPSVTKPYVLWNNTSGAFTVNVKTTGATGVQVPQSAVMQIFCDSASVRADRTSIGNAVLQATSAAAVRTVIGAGTGSGSVTSIAVSGGAGVSVANGSITTSGNITVQLDIAELTSISDPSHESDSIVVYHASAGGARKTSMRSFVGDYFSVHKNSTNQGSITNGTSHKVTFSTEDADTASVFDTSTSRFVPANGTRWVLSASANVTSGGDGIIVGMEIYKNGSIFKRGPSHIAGGSNVTGALFAGVVVEGNGTDYYEVYFALSNSGSTLTLSGDTSRTWFTGYRIG
jgi:hypothetical protein